MADTVQTLEVRGVPIEIHQSKAEAGRAAADQGLRKLREQLSQQQRARILISTGNSQLELVEALVGADDIRWEAVEIFHLDEYVGISTTHPASFRRWVRERVVERVHPRQAHYLDGDAPDPQVECNRYTELLKEAPIDVAFIGFGENGHIAFNDPPVADLNDAETVKRVMLDQICRRQQVGEGHFATLDDVPKEALTLTCPAIMSARHLIACVPEKRKAAAVRDAVEGPLSTRCPASVVFTHPSATVFLDRDSASLLSGVEAAR